MPSVSKSQQRLMAAAEHGADFPMAKKLRKSMSHDQLHDFAVGSMKSKPEHVLKGSSNDVVHENVKTFKNAGLSEHDAVKKALKKSNSHPNRHLNLGKYLHPKKEKPMDVETMAAASEPDDTDNTESF